MLVYVMISYDLAAARYLSTQLAVMYAGKLVEVGACDAVYRPRCIPIPRRCCRRHCPYILRHGGSVLSCPARYPIPYISPPAAVFIPAARTPCRRALWISRHGKRSGAIRRPPVICMPDAGVTRAYYIL
jgi:hypothetical protein